MHLCLRFEPKSNLKTGCNGIDVYTIKTVLTKINLKHLEFSRFCM